MNEMIKRRLKETKSISTQEIVLMICKAEVGRHCDIQYYGRVGYCTMSKLVYWEQIYTARKLIEQEREERAALKSAKEADAKRRRKRA